MLHVLLEAPATDLNGLISCAHPPLQFATLAGDLALVQMLLTHGAKPSIATDSAPVPLALATSSDIMVELLQHGATFDPLIGNQVTGVIYKVLHAPVDQLHLTTEERKKLLLSAAGWHWNLTRVVNDESFCRGFSQQDIYASPSFGSSYKEWDALPFTQYLQLSAEAQKSIDLSATCPWKNSEFTTIAYKQDLVPHSGNIVEDIVIVVKYAAAGLLVGFLVYAVQKCARAHAATHRAACRLAARHDAMERAAYAHRADAVASRAAADIAQRAAARATQRAVRAEATAVLAVAQRGAAVTARDTSVTARDTSVTARDAAVSERDAVITERDAVVTERDTAVAHATTTSTMCDAVYVQLRRLTRSVQCITTEINHAAVDGGVALTATHLHYYAGACLQKANSAQMISERLLLAVQAGSGAAISINDVAVCYSHYLLHLCVRFGAFIRGPERKERSDEAAVGREH
jgi:hypothetical protein